MEEDGSSCNKHWCDGIAIGFGNDTLYIGLSSTFRDLSSANPSVDVNFYRNESGKWHRTATETFADNEEKSVHLLGTFVDSKLHAIKRRMAVGSSKWEFVTFKAKITKTSNKVNYQVSWSRWSVPPTVKIYNHLRSFAHLTTFSHRQKMPYWSLSWSVKMVRN